MNSGLHSLLQPRSLFGGFAVVACLAFAIGAAPLPCHALTAYSVSIDTGSLASGTKGLLAFDLIHGDGTLANNTAFVSGFVTDGTLDSLGAFGLTDTDFFNEELREITFGSFVSFKFQLTENASAPGVDQFSFFLLDPDSFLPLFSTSDSLGTDALFAIDINGLPGSELSLFEPVGAPISWNVTASPVPDGGSTAGLLVLGSLGLLGIAARGWRGRGV